MGDEIILQETANGLYCIVFLSEGKEVTRSKPMAKELAEEQIKDLT
jgi:hypothetical protein